VIFFSIFHCIFAAIIQLAQGPEVQVSNTSENENFWKIPRIA